MCDGPSKYVGSATWMHKKTVSACVGILIRLTVATSWKEKPEACCQRIASNTVQGLNKPIKFFHDIVFTTMPSIDKWNYYSQKLQSAKQCMQKVMVDWKWREIKLS